MSSQSRKLKTFKVHACTHCRTNKTRCELLNLQETDLDEIKCHRCRVLGIGCSYSDMDTSIFLPFIAAAKPSESPPTHSRASSTPSSPPGSGIMLDPAVSLTGSSYSSSSGEETPMRRLAIMHSLCSSFQVPVDTTIPLATVQRILNPEAPLLQARVGDILDRNLESILDRDHIRHLRHRFCSDFQPWLNFPYMRDNGAILDVIACTVASRYSDDHSTVLPRLQKLTNETISKIIRDGPYQASLEAIQALLIVSLWPGPTSMAQSKIPNSQVLISAAVSMAIMLRLNIASTRVLKLKSSGYATAVELSELTDKARLWTSLTNIESLLCLGTGLNPRSRRSKADREFIPSSVFSPSTLIDCRDARLKLLSEMLSCTETAATFQLFDIENIDEWRVQLTRTTLEPLENVRRVILPLQVLSDHDQFHFHMLMLILNGCKMQICLRALQSLQILLDYPSASELIAETGKPHGIEVLTGYGSELAHLSEAILVSALQTDARIFSMTPDAVFSMIAFAGVFVVGIQCFTLQARRSAPTGSADNLLRRLSAHLQKSSRFPGDVPENCARFLTILLEKLESLRVNVTLLDDSAASPSPGQLSEPSPFAPIGTEPGMLAWGNAGIFGDSAFWSQMLFPGEEGQRYSDLDIYNQMATG
ncbi:hypothetical protein C8J56DRAFT_930103 [Mycena floridula]|nr:hypothetical protein C8J56DRAFT_930103 [Mycena floridula]